jgi:beta-glucosidase
VKGTVHGDVQHATQDNGLPTTDGLDNIRRSVELTAGKHSIEVVTSVDTSNAPVQVRLNWTTPEARRAAHREALDAARTAGTAVVFVWTRDKPHFELPGDQDQLIEEIAAINPNTVVVLNTSQPIAMPWINKVKGVIEMWWPGDDGGMAEARTLLGLNNPGGKLPMTWGMSLADYPATSPAHPERSTKGVDGKTTFSEGVLVGYRWFDDQDIEPLYPFGFGLSYTRFELSGLKAQSGPDGGVEVNLKVRNTGAVRGDEVPQIYLAAPAVKPQGVQFAPKTLVAFERVSLDPGQERELSLHVPKRALQYWSVSEKQWVTPAGPRTLLAGTSSRALPLRETIPGR